MGRSTADMANLGARRKKRLVTEARENYTSNRRRAATERPLLAAIPSTSDRPRPRSTEIVHVMVSARAAQPSPPFDGPIAISASHPLDPKQRLSGLDSQQRRRRSVGDNGPELFRRLDDAHAELRFEQTVHGTAISLHLGTAQPLEQRGG